MIEGSNQGGGLDFLAGGGEMGALMRGHDWSMSPLGAPESWPQSLRSIVGLMLGSKFPMFAAWGAELGFLYNDSYAPILGGKHPEALGRRFHDVWPEIWPDISPLIDAALAGEASYFENLPLVMHRRGFHEGTWFTFSYSPVRDESGCVAGMFCACSETTAQVLSDRRLSEEKERQRRLFEKAPGFTTILTGPDLVFQFVNDAYTRLFSQRDYIGHTVRQVFHDLEGQGIFELLEQAYATGQRFVADGIAVRLQPSPDGPPRGLRLDFICEPIKDDAGCTTGLFVQGYDVTARTLAEEALRATWEKESFLVALGDTLRLLSDPSGLVAATTRAVGERLGALRVVYSDIDEAGEVATTEGDWTDGTAAHLPHRLVISDFGQELVAALATGDTLVVEDTRTHPATMDSLAALEAIGVGALVSVPLVKEGRFAANLNVHSRAPRGWTALEVDLIEAVAERTWDVLARARAVKAVAERERELQTLTDTLPALISYVDAERRYRFINKVYEEWFPKRREDILGKPVAEVIGEAAYASVLPYMDRVLAGERLRFEQPMPYAEAGLRHIEVEYVPRQAADGRVEGFYALVQDMTERVAAQAALRGSEARLRFLDGLGAATAPLSDADAVLATTTRCLGEHLNLSVCAYADMDEDEDGFTIRGDWAAPGSSSIVGHYSLADFGKLAVEKLSAGEPLIVNDNLRELAPDEAATFQAIGITATICMPLVKEGRLTALMAIHDRAPRVWSDEELSLLREVTSRSWAHVERVGAAAELRASEAELRDLNADLERQVVERTQARGRTWQISPDLMGALNADGYFETSNPAWKTVLGWSEAEVARMSIWELLHPDDLEATRAGFALTQVGQPAIQFPNRYRCKDGSYRWISWVAVPEDGLVYSTGRDITAEKEREAQLAASTAERDRLWELSPDLLTVVDYEGRLLRVNPSWTRVLGYDEERLLTRPYVEILHPDEIESIAALLAEMKATERPVLLEDRLLAADGTWRSFVWTLSPEPGGERIYGVGRDVTDERAQAKALAARTAERDRLWTLSADMLARADYAGMMSAVSPAWTRVLGWSETELLTRPYASFMHSDDMEPTLAALLRMGETGQPTRFENRIASREGGWKPIEWTVAPEAEGFNFIAVGRDLSAMKAREAELAATQEALRQSQKMEAMGQLTGGVAHDFNNLLTPIIGSLDMLTRRGLGNERERRLIDGAMQSAERAKILVQRLLAFARRQPLQAVAVDLGTLIDGMAGLIGSTVGPGVDLRVELQDDLPPAKADPNQLEMAILNLGVNARDAMPDGGTLTIAAVRESVHPGHRSGLRQGHYVRLSVSDTGTGMDEATLARAIEPFFSTKGIGKGTGLGLSMVHGLAAQLGGGLTIASELGRGTIVDLWLPLSIDLLGGADDVQPAPPTTKVRGRALLVDDEDLVRMSTADMLADLGYEVVEVASAEEALRLIKGGSVTDLLVTDHLMPGMTGADLARAVRILMPGLPILIVSGYAEVEGIAPDLPRLSKPFRNAELAERLTSLMPAAVGTA